MQHPVIVLKLGGSVLRGEHDLTHAVHEIYRWTRQGYRVVAVVSAFEGTTDALLSRANAIAPDGPDEARSLLLATGEFSVAALLTLALARAGLDTAIFNPYQLDLRTRGSGIDADPASINHAALREGLERASVVITPGFVGVGSHGELTLLGRGGSDLTALFIAATLRARCRLIKDVDGLYERDPALPGPAPRRFRTLDWDRALQLNGGIVQHKGVRLAKAHALTFEVGAFQRDDVSIVTQGQTSFYEHTDASHRAPAAPLRVALLGLGTVGTGVALHLLEHPQRFSITGALVQNATQPRDLPDSPPLPITTDPQQALRNAEVVVELIGGVTTARSLVEKALRSGAHVVTANKALLAESGPSLVRLANDHGGSLRSSAAVGGSVPMLETIARCAPHIESIEGVVNGTTNFILELIARGTDQDEALREAQRLGYAEKDPTRDIDGTDALDKIVLLARLAFPDAPEPKVVTHLGLNPRIIQTLRASLSDGATVRLVAWARRTRTGVEVGVEPRIVSRTHPLAHLPGATNRLVVRTSTGQSHVASGKGAGRWPTAESVLADLLDLDRTRRNLATTSGPASPDQPSSAEVPLDR